MELGGSFTVATAAAPLVSVRFRFAGDGEVVASGSEGGVRAPLGLVSATSVAMAMVMGDTDGDLRERDAGGWGRDALLDLPRATRRGRRPSD